MFRTINKPTFGFAFNYIPPEAYRALRELMLEQDKKDLFEKIQHIAENYLFTFDKDAIPFYIVATAEPTLENLANNPQLAPLASPMELYLYDNGTIEFSFGERLDPQLQIKRDKISLKEQRSERLRLRNKTKAALFSTARAEKSTSGQHEHSKHTQTHKPY